MGHVTVVSHFLSNASPGGAAFPASSVLTKPRHLRNDRSRPGDILALGRDVHRMDTTMDLVIASGLAKSCLPSSSRSSEFVLKGAERAKFGKDIHAIHQPDLLFLNNAVDPFGT